MNINSVVRHLRSAQSKAEKELNGINQALAALGKKPMGTSRVLSKEARKRIGDAQRARWARAKRPQLVKNGRKAA